MQIVVYHAGAAQKLKNALVAHVNYHAKIGADNISAHCY